MSGSVQDQSLLCKEEHALVGRSSLPNSKDPLLQIVSTEGERGAGGRGPMGWLPRAPRLIASKLKEGGVPLQGKDALSREGAFLSVGGLSLVRANECMLHHAFCPLVG
eukprot:867429-Pelagomonas_calceolata.AAC.3